MAHLAAVQVQPLPPQLGALPYTVQKELLAAVPAAYIPHLISTQVQEVEVVPM
jgi:hypothetical protein